MAPRHENPSDWQDKPETKPFPIEMAREGRPNETLALNIGNCAIALFRNREEMDYLAILDEETGDWTFIFDRQPMVYWMGGLALHKEGRHQQRLVERNAGEFYDIYGFNPDVVIEDYPSQNEVDIYIDHLMNQDLHDDLNQQLKEDLEDES